MPSDTAKEILCGSAAGMFGRIVEHPFDLVKVRLQTQQSIMSQTAALSSGNPANVTQLFSGPLDCFRTTIRREGVLGLYQGITSPMAGAIAETATLFVAFNRIQEFAMSLKSPDGQQQELSLPMLALCGSFAGACASLALTPFELVKCRLQTDNIRKYGDSQSIKRRSGPLTIIKEVLKTEGPLGFYRGLSSTFIREGVGSSIWFSSYEFMCRHLLKRNHPEANGRSTKVEKSLLTAGEVMLSGSFAGVVYNSLIFPVDTLKSIEQTSRASSSSKLNIIKTILRQDGIKGFYRGLGITLFRAVPGNAVIFLVFETLAKRWDIVFKSDDLLAIERQIHT